MPINEYNNINALGRRTVFSAAARKRKIKNWCLGVLFALPVILGVLIFTYYPAIQSVVYSFNDYNIFESQFIGFRNYVYMFTIDTETYKVFGNTLLYALLSVPFGLIIGC